MPHATFHPETCDLYIPRVTAIVLMHATDALPTLGLLNISSTGIVLPELKHSQLPNAAIGTTMRRWVGLSRWPAFWVQTVKMLGALDFGVAIPAAAAFGFFAYRSRSKHQMALAMSHVVLCGTIPSIVYKVTGQWSTILPPVVGVSLCLLAADSMSRTQQVSWKVRAALCSALSLLQVTQLVSRYRGEQSKPISQNVDHGQTTLELQTLPTRSSAETLFSKISLGVIVLSTTFILVRSRRLILK